MRPPTHQEKGRYLKSMGGHHPAPERVTDELFQESEFFDSRDLAQVRYEMLRRHRVDGKSVSEIARSFGVSRQTFYQIAAVFEKHGLCGLVPQRRGPKAPHKCSQKILDFVRSLRLGGPEMTWKEVAAKVEEAFGTRLHPRTLERKYANQKKKR